MNFVEKAITHAPDAFRHLHGYLCVFKPADRGLTWLRGILKLQLCEGLNALQQRPVKTDVEIVGTLKKNNLEVISRPSYADNPLVVGPRYQVQDIKLQIVNFIPWSASGVTLLAVYPRRPETQMLRSSNMISTYHLDCVLGTATDTGRTDGRIIDGSKYRHVTPVLLERILGTIQANFQKDAYLYAGVRPDSEEAFKLMSSGLIRPNDAGSPPLIYSIRCVALEPPNFTLELQVINESDTFLCELVQNIGKKVRSAAAIERLRLMRFGPFKADMALLQRNWRLDQILMNIQATNRMVDELRYSGLFGMSTPGESVLKVVKE